MTRLGLELETDGDGETRRRTAPGHRGLGLGPWSPPAPASDHVPGPATQAIVGR